MGGQGSAQNQAIIRVTYLTRKPRPFGNFSIEFIFREIRSKLPAHIQSDILECRYQSNGLWRRVYNLFEAAFRRGDILHITGDVNYLALLTPRRKTVLTIHDLYTLTFKTGLAHWLEKTFWYDLPVKRCRYVVAVSEATKQEILRLLPCPAEKIVVIPVPVPTRYQPCPKPFNHKKPVILQVGVMPNKNLERLIEAVEGIPCHISIVGKLLDHQKQLLEEKGQPYSVAYRVSDEEMLAQYESCDLLYFASTYEGFGMPIVEANGVGRAVLSSRVSSMPYVAGDAAHLVDPFDVASIRDGLLRLIHDDKYRNQLIAKGFVNRQRFLAEEIAGAHAALYDRIFEENRRGN